MKKKIMPALVVIGLIALIIGIVILVTVIRKYTPSSELADLNAHYNVSSSDEAAIFYNYEEIDEKARVIDGHIYLSYDFIHQNINERFYWDSNENLLLYTTASDLITINAGESTYLVGRDSASADRVIVDISSGSPFIDIDFVKEYSDFLYEAYTNPGRVSIVNAYGTIDVATLKKDARVREEADIKSPILEELLREDVVTVLSSGESWDYVLTANGHIGYIQNKHLTERSTETVSSTYVAETFSHVLMDEEICMGWQIVTNPVANNNLSSILAKSKSLNVISPTWFCLDDNEGNVRDFGSVEYVNTCHAQGIKVWAMINNLDNPEVDSTYVLTHTSVRQNLVNQLISLAIQYNLDGLNIDFESLSSDVGDGYIQFIRELSLKCHNNGIVLSVDNYVPSAYTEFYNRAEQALFADYVVIMGYDEHFSGSDEVGSVASLSWVTEGVNNTLNSVPANQVILGMPFYTRLWCKTPNGSEDDDVIDADNYSISSQALSMSEANDVIEEKDAEKTWLPEAGQFYATYTENGNTYEIWLEDSNSLEERIDLMHDTNLAGCAFWRLGLEESSIWDTISKYY